MTSRYFEIFNTIVVLLVTAGLAIFFPAAVLLEIAGLLRIA